MPMLSPNRETATGTTTSPEEARVSSFRNLYTRVLLGLQAEQHHVLGVTSAIEGEGKTTIAAGLASALAEDGALLGFGRTPATTVLVECNAGPPPDDPRLALRPGPGLVEVLSGECELEATLQEPGVERLSVLPAGGQPQRLALAIRAATLPKVMAQLRKKFGLVVLDLPSVLNSTDTQVLARLADQIVLVVRAEVTPSQLVKQALDRLDEAKVLGVVLNDAQPSLPPWLENRL